MPKPVQEAKLYSVDGINNLPVTSAPATVMWSAATKVYPLGVFDYNGIKYKLGSGLNRFRAPMQNTTNMIAGNDAISLLSAGCHLICYGDLDDRGTESEAVWLSAKFSKALTGLLAMTCTNCCLYIKKNILDIAGIQSRLIRFVTLGTPNYYADGHVCLEVKIGGQWVLVDCSTNSLFRRIDNSLMPAKETPSAVAVGDVIRTKLANDGANNGEAVPNYSFDAAGWYMENVVGKEDEWQRKIFNAVGFEHSDGKIYWLMPDDYTPANQAWVEGLSPNFRVSNLAFINANFYGQA